MKYMHVLEKDGERQLFYAKHAKMCLILIIGVNYVSAFITSAPLFLTCCVEPPEVLQGRVAGGGGSTLAFTSLQEEGQDGLFCFVLAEGGAD